MVMVGLDRVEDEAVTAETQKADVVNAVRALYALAGAVLFIGAMLLGGN